MDWTLELTFAGRVLLAAALGAIVGWDREAKGRDAGVRTYGAVSLGSCTFGLISAFASGDADPTRVSAQVVTGIGFLCAGVIIQEHGRVKGLTTAATVWATASVGLAVSYGLYLLAILTALLTLALLAAQRPGEERSHALSSRDEDSSRHEARDGH